MNESHFHASVPRRRSAVIRLLLPSTEIRVAIALLITFFPYGVLYSALYPVSELITIAAWVWAFPSPIGCVSVALMPLVMNVSYGYFAFNVFCIVANFAIAHAALQRKSLSPALVRKAYRMARLCMLFTLLLCFTQLIIEPSVWMSAVPGILLPGGRGAGLRSEPSLLAGPLTVFLCLLALRMEAVKALGEPNTAGSKIFRGGLASMLVLVGVTQSLSVLIVVLVFAPMLLLRPKHIVLQTTGLLAAASIAVAAFSDRIHEAVESSGGSFLTMITLGLGSWRNIPDILVIANARSYLWPGNPLEVRAKLNDFAVAINPGLSWLQFTHSTFSACATTLGLVLTAVLFLAGLRTGMKLLSAPAGAKATWILLYIANWFLTPKYDVCGWVALGLLTWSGRITARDPSADDAAVPECPAICFMAPRRGDEGFARPATETTIHGGASC